MARETSNTLESQPMPDNGVNGGNSAIPPSMIMLLGGFGVFVIFAAIAGSFSSRSRKNVLSTARWASKRDIKSGRERARKQILGDKHDEVALWVNSPKLIEANKVSKDADTIYFPDMARGSAVIGGSGSGKSYSVIKPMLRSAIAQGLPVVLLDTDYPGLAKTIAPLAESLGYDVHILAPGYAESGTCNVLDFIDSPRDSTGASQISKTLNRNFAMGEGKNDDPFFKAAGELATEGALLLAKALKHKDILTAFTILKDEDMIDRVRGVGKIDPWLELAFGQLLSTAKSEKTVDSIRGTAALLFGQLMRPDILPALMGETSIPLTLTGKKLLIFGVKQNIRLVVSPLIASVIHALITKNVVPGRKEPLFLSLDEMPSMYFPEIAEWLSEKRKYGLCTQLGYQSMGQLKKTYGPELANVIVTNTATKVFFNPQEVESAKFFSETLGEEAVVYKTTNGSYGKSRSRGRTEHRSKKRLFSPDEFMGLDSGCCVLVSPGYGSGNRRFVPIKFSPIKITNNEIKTQSAIEDHWEEFRAKMVKRGVNGKQVNPKEIEKRSADFRARLPVEVNRADFLKDVLS